MSVHSAHNRNNSDIFEVPPSQKSSSLSAVTHGGQLKLHLKSNISESENDDPLLGSTSKIRDINSTYVISACKKSGDLPLTPKPVERLTLQRRATRNKDSLLGSELGDTTEKTAETSLTLQRRRAKMDSVEKCKAVKRDPVEKWKIMQNVGSEAENCASQETRPNAKGISNSKNSCVASSARLAEQSNAIETTGDEKYKESFSVFSGTKENVSLKYSSSRAPIGSQGQTEVVKSGHLAVKPTQSKLDIQVWGTGSVHQSIGKDVVKNSNKFGNLEKRTPVKCITEHKLTPKHCLPQLKSPAASILKNRMPSLQDKQRPKSSLLANKRERSQENTLPPEEKTTVQNNTSIETDLLKIENSQVTVAVRVRPFSKRYVTYF
jgi:kinesin family protein 14